MNPIISRRFLAAVLLVCAVSAHAELGGWLSAPVPVPAKASASSGLPNQVAAAAVLSVPVQISESLLDTNTLVREYATSTGRVFAVSWRGPVLPDLAALLGTHFPTFKLAAEQARAQGHRSAGISVRQDGLVMRSTGRMRAFEGYAYAPALAPAGVNVDDIIQ